MYSRSVILPMTDLDEIVTLVVEVPGLNLTGNELPQPGLARTRGVSPARTPRASVRGAIIAIVERKETDCRTDHLKPRHTRHLYRITGKKRNGCGHLPSVAHDQLNGPGSAQLSAVDCNGQTSFGPLLSAEMRFYARGSKQSVNNISLGL